MKKQENGSDLTLAKLPGSGSTESSQPEDIREDALPDDEIEVDRGTSRLLPGKQNMDESPRNFKPLDLVWAKCKGQFSQPALIMNPELSPHEELLHGNQALPRPTPYTIQLGKKVNELHYLVLLLDPQVARRTWYAQHLKMLSGC